MTKSIGLKAENRKNRFRINSESIKNLMEDKSSQERSPPSRDEILCKNCGFKTRYRFLRCPECDFLQE